MSNARIDGDDGSVVVQACRIGEHRYALIYDDDGRGKLEAVKAAARWLFDEDLNFGWREMGELVRQMNEA